jgi:hypothetical protein
MALESGLLLTGMHGSFCINWEPIKLGEHPPTQRIVRWGQAIAEADQVQFSREELERPQQIVIGDARFVSLHSRTEDGFVGECDWSIGEPFPDHVSARSEDLPAPVEDVAGVDDCSSGAGFEPVIASTVFTFDFVHTRPFVDGNGRLDRWLIHPVHARGNFNPPGVILPTSAANLRRLELYRLLLESYSPPLLKDIDWVFKMDGNVEIRNATADPYHFFDATAQAEFLFWSCGWNRWRWSYEGGPILQNIGCLRKSRWDVLWYAKDNPEPVVAVPTAETTAGAPNARGNAISQLPDWRTSTPCIQKNYNASNSIQPV